MSSPEFKAGIGGRVRLQRTNQGLSLDELAGNIDMSKTGLWEIEKGHNEPMASTLLRLSIALHCSIDYLVRGIE